MIEVLGEFSWIVALLLGFGGAWVIQSLRLASGSKASQEERAAEKEAAARLQERADRLEETLGEERAALEELRSENTGLHGKLAASSERLEAQEKRIAEQKTELESIQKKLTADFENLANRILDEKSKKFVSQNQENLDKLLKPFGERIKDFRERVDTVHEQGVKDRAALNEQLKNLHSLNQQMTQEAQNLTSALKGQTKTQGNWGEMILERVLEMSGLTAGQDYETQASLTDDDGRRFQPDVIVHLPERKHLVVDSKVSLIAYEACANEEDPKTYDSRLKEHVASVKTHVNELNNKNYESLYGINSPDFVLMFVPIEPAFTMAMQADDTLLEFAIGKRVVIVTPSTLLATLRMVANIWRQEKQSRNVMKIAQSSGDLYDKFVGFYADLEAIGKSIGKSQEAYESAANKLKTGKGNLIKRVEDIKNLGVKTKKSLPPEAVEDSLLEE